MKLRDLTVRAGLEVAPDPVLAAALDVHARAFGTPPESGRERGARTMLQAMRQGRVLGCYKPAEDSKLVGDADHGAGQEPSGGHGAAGDHLVGIATIRPFHQWWHGRSLPMAGVAGVAVAPEERGRGVGTLLVAGLLERIAARGYPLSALYPATAPLYRSCGWEIAGAQHLVTVAAEALRGLPTAAIPLRRVGPGDAAAILSVVRRTHTAARSSGPIDWDEAGVRDWLVEEQPYAYLANDGFLAYHWEGDSLEVDELVAGSGDTARALWGLVGSGSSVATEVRACIGPTDPLRWLTREAAVQPREEKRWMLRLIDAPAALAGRGYPPGVEIDVPLRLADPQLPGNTGSWRLTVSNGAGRVCAIVPLQEAERDDTQGRAGRADLPGTAGTEASATRLGPRGLAALYAGVPLATLRQAGLAHGGGPHSDALLDAAFAAQPYLLDYF